MQNVLSTIVPVQAKQQLNDAHQKVWNINVVCVQTFLGKTTCIHHNVSIHHRKPSLKTLSPASPNSQGYKQYSIFTTAVPCKLWIVHGTCTKGMKLDTVRFMDLYMKNNMQISQHQCICRRKCWLKIWLQPPENYSGCKQYYTWYLEGTLS